jgi:HPt (histidine-containing phosphotransfer) domain-containing protein
MAGERSKVLAAGMDDYLSKPLQHAPLLRVLRHWIPEAFRGYDEVEDSGTVASVRPTDEAEHRASRAPENASEAAESQAGSAHVARSLNPNTPRADRVVKLFLARVPDQLSELKAAIVEGDPTAVRNHAHKLKGSALSLGASKMAQTCLLLQHVGETSDLDKSTALFERLQSEFSRVAALLEAHHREAS